VEVPSCPECGAEEFTELRATAQHLTLQCAECHAVRTVTVRRPRATQLPVIFSDGDKSWREVLDVPGEEPVIVGYEFEHEGHRYRVTGIERRDGVGATKANARDLKQMAAKKFDRVLLKFTLNEGETTQSLQLEVEPEEQVVVGSIMLAEGRLVLVKALKSDTNRTVRKGHLLAYQVVRVFCDPAPPGAVEGDKRKPPKVYGLGPPRRRR
jgi:uncharacterized Zn finger protein